MRKSDYYGYKHGARVVELRRGSVHHVDIGSVERFSPEHRAMGAGILRFTPATTISGQPARDLAATLARLSIECARGEISQAERTDQFDAVIRGSVSL